MAHAHRGDQARCWYNVALLTVRLLLNPIPFSNVVPAILIALIALAYLEEDGCDSPSASSRVALIVVSMARCS